MDISFLLNGETVRTEAGPTETLLDFLRERRGLKGTKEGCNEGDCGACTVVIASLAEPGDAHAVRGLKLQTVNACIQFLPTLDGKALFGVEDLKAITPDRALHPVQQAMVECHGSQCGFCTPGFVMSLWAGYETHRACGTTPSRQALADELSGNLCRCTGYRPILDAGQRMFELPAVQLDTAPVVAALRSMASDEETFAYRNRFFAPKTLEALAALREAKPEARLVAGATDVGLWVNKQFRDLGEVIYVGGVKALRAIEERDGALRIAAAASLEDAWRALAQRWPALTDVWLRFASPPVRHAGTMGGNLANGSPIGDSAPILMALDAQIELRRAHHIRCMPLPDFYVDYMKNRLEPGEFVQAIVVPALAADRQVRGYKISKRFDCDISAVCAGFGIELDGETVRTVRLAFGGMAGVVKRAAQAEAALLGQPWNEASVRAAQAALARDFTPLTDMRASAAHRAQVAANLLMRFWLETRPHDPLPPSATSVFAAMTHEEA